MYKFKRYIILILISLLSYNSNAQTTQATQGYVNRSISNSLIVVDGMISNACLAVSNRINEVFSKSWTNPPYASDFTWTSDSKEITITSYIGAGGNVRIPDILDGLPVTKIGTNAFTYTLQTVKNIYGGHNVNFIDNYAFKDCDALTNISLINVKVIGDSTFLPALGLKSINLPKLEILGLYNFTASQLTTISFPTLKIIGNQGFYNSPLTTVYLPVVESIGDQSFAYCSNLKSVYFSGNKPIEGSIIYDQITANQVTNYVTNPTATGWGTTFGGMPVVRMALYGNASNLTGITSHVTDRPTFIQTTNIIYNINSNNQFISVYSSNTNNSGFITSLVFNASGNMITQYYGGGIMLTDVVKIVETTAGITNRPNTNGIISLNLGNISYQNSNNVNIGTVNLSKVTFENGSFTNRFNGINLNTNLYVNDIYVSSIDVGWLFAPTNVDYSITSENDTNKVLSPNGIGGVQWKTITIPPAITNIEVMTSTETNKTKYLAPNGTNGVEWKILSIPPTITNIEVMTSTETNKTKYLAPNGTNGVEWKQAYSIPTGPGVLYITPTGQLVATNLFQEVYAAWYYPELIADDAWHALDISSVVPAHASEVLISCYVAKSTTSINIYIAKYGETDAAKAYRASSYTGNGVTGWAYIKATTFQSIYYRISETSPTTAAIKVMGYRL